MTEDEIKWADAFIGREVVKQFHWFTVCAWSMGYRGKGVWLLGPRSITVRAERKYVPFPKGGVK